ncbi:MAG TPA: hypothetical protein VJW20_00185 [Candidatus Angelobacter sp.]|nr:hypothetical protein [Candidatus Angelobacter sp.]
MKHDRIPYRRVRMTKQMREILEEQRKRFRQKFGRDPRPDDPVIWDESAAEPTPASEEDIHQTILSALIKAGSRPEFIYAFNKTGRLVTESNQHLLTPAEYQEWVDAVEEFRRLN